MTRDSTADSAGPPRKRAAPERPLPVVFALHDRHDAYWLNTAVAMTSLLKHTSRPVSVHILHDQSLSARARERLLEIAQEMGGSLSFVEQALPADIDRKVLGKFSPASIFRLMIPRLFPDEEVVIYLDSDLVVNGVDIHELRMAASPEAPISAAVDVFIDQPETHAKNLEALELDARTYFNSGVMAFRPRLITGDLVAEFAEFSRSNPRALHPDQDFLNLRFRGQVHHIDERFNTLLTFLDERFTQPLSFYANRILHYAGSLKPLDGGISPAFLPFFAHAFAVPEIYSGARYKAKMYVFPVAGRPDRARGLSIDRDPLPWKQ